MTKPAVVLVYGMRHVNERLLHAYWRGLQQDIL